MSAGTDIKPCPFCGAALEPFGPVQHNHPRNHCWLKSVRIMDVDRESWNSRPSQPDSERDAALLEVGDLYANEAGRISGSMPVFSTTVTIPPGRHTLYIKAAQQGDAQPLPGDKP